MGAETARRENMVRELFWTRTGLLLLALIIVAGSSLFLSAAVPAGTARNLLTALGTGTLITSIVTFGQTLITAGATQRAMVTPLIEENRRALRTLSAEYRSLNREFFPTDVFEATEAPDPAFNHLLMRDLDATRQYLFRGFSGRHAAARLLLSSGERELRAVVADPTNPAALSGRARHIARHEGSVAGNDRGTDLEAILHRLHDEICVGLVGLFVARAHCSRIDITLVADPPLDRVELFDGSVWVTLYSDSTAGNVYPRTLRFSEESFIYGMEWAELSRINSSPQAGHIVITPSTGRPEFIGQLVEVTGSRMPARIFAEREAEFHGFRREFAARAELVG